MENKSHLSPRVGTMQQMGSAQTKASSSRHAGGPRPTWVDQFQPTTNPMHPDVVQIVRAVYPAKAKDDTGETLVDVGYPWGAWISHYDSHAKTSGVCSAGPWAGSKKKAQPCRGCDLFFSLMRKDPTTGKNTLGPINKRDMYSFSVIHYHPYHLVEQLNKKDGTIKVNQKTGEPFWQLWICGIENCEHCANGKMIISARRLHWDMGMSHWNKLLERDAMLSRCCKNCSGRNTVTWEAHVCSNPECEHPFFEHGKTNIGEEHILEAVKKPMLCPRCGNYAWPKEYDSCSGCGGACRPASIFDVRLHVHRTAIVGKNGTELSIDDWEEAYDGILVPEDVGRHSQEMADDMLLPLELPKILAPTSMEQQMKIYGGGGGGRQPVAAEYGKNTTD